MATLVCPKCGARNEVNPILIRQMCCRCDWIFWLGGTPVDESHFNALTHKELLENPAFRKQIVSQRARPAFPLKPFREWKPASQAAAIAAPFILILFVVSFFIARANLSGPPTANSSSPTVEQASPSDSDSAWWAWTRKAKRGNEGLVDVGLRRDISGKMEITLLAEAPPMSGIPEEQDAAIAAMMAVLPRVAEGAWEDANRSFPGRVGNVFILIENAAAAGRFMPVGHYSPTAGWVFSSEIPRRSQDTIP